MNQNLQNELSPKLGRISARLMEFITEFSTATVDRQIPYEATMTDLLIVYLRREGFIVTRTATSTEGKVGHDLQVKYFSLNPQGNNEVLAWACLLQAKMMKSNVVDFGYRRDRAGHVAFIQQQKDAVQKQLTDYKAQLAKAEANSNLSNQLYYTERVEEKEQLLEGLRTEGMSQAGLLANAINNVPQSMGGPGMVYNGGYVVYDTAGIYFLPINEVVAQVDNNVSNTEITQQLLGTTQLKQRFSLQAMVIEGVHVA